MRPLEPALLPISIENGPHRGSLLALVQSLRQYLGFAATRVNNVLPKDGTEAMTGPLMLATFTTGTLPTASAWPGGIIYVSDGAAGAKFRGSDGATWVNLG